MTLDEITGLAQDSTHYLVHAATEDHDGVILVLQGTAPNGEPVNSSVMFTRLELADCKYPEIVVRHRTKQASDALSRFFDSFEAPNWDAMKWGS